MKVLMLPHKSDIRLDNGLGRVIQKYFEYLPKVDIELVDKTATSFDLIASHVAARVECDVHHNHGLWWASYPTNEKQHRQNARIIKSCCYAKVITVPSQWVAESFKRDMHISPYVIPHGIECSEWQHNETNKGYVLWNKNRAGDACDPSPINELAKRFPNIKFVSTFGERDDNVYITGRLPFYQMKRLVQQANIYLATTKETFGIGTLEALVSGIPILGFAWGGTLDIVTNKQDGYLVNPYDYDALAEGLNYVLKHHKELSENAKQTAKKYTWLAVAQKIKEVYNMCIDNTNGD